LNIHHNLVLHPSPDASEYWSSRGPRCVPDEAPSGTRDGKILLPFNLKKTDARDALYEVRWIQQSGLSGCEGGRRLGEVVQSRGSAVNEEERSTDWRERD
jgi:hypothetical protein